MQRKDGHCCVAPSPRKLSSWSKRNADTCCRIGRRFSAERFSRKVWMTRVQDYNKVSFAQMIRRLRFQRSDFEILEGVCEWSMFPNPCYYWIPIGLFEPILRIYCRPSWVSIIDVEGSQFYWLLDELKRVLAPFPIELNQNSPAEIECRDKDGELNTALVSVLRIIGIGTRRDMLDWDFWGIENLKFLSLSWKNEN